MKLRKTNNIIGNYVNWLFLLSNVIFIINIQFPTVVLSEKKKLCGEFGFRCISNNSYEFCDVPGEDCHTSACHSVEDSGEAYSPSTFHCPDGTVCDDKYIYFCSPVNPVNGKHQQSTTHRVAAADHGTSETTAKYHSTTNRLESTHQTFEDTIESNAVDKTKLRNVRMEEELSALKRGCPIINSRATTGKCTGTKCTNSTPFSKPTTTECGKTSPCIVRTTKRKCPTVKKTCPTSTRCPTQQLCLKTKPICPQQKHTRRAGREESCKTTKSKCSTKKCQNKCKVIPATSTLTYNHVEESYAMKEPTNSLSKSTDTEQIITKYINTSAYTTRQKLKLPLKYSTAYGDTTSMFLPFFPKSTLISSQKYSSTKKMSEVDDTTTEIDLTQPQEFYNSYNELTNSFNRPFVYANQSAINSNLYQLSSPSHEMPLQQQFEYSISPPYKTNVELYEMSSHESNETSPEIVIPGYFEKHITNAFNEHYKREPFISNTMPAPVNINSPTSLYSFKTVAQNFRLSRRRKSVKNSSTKRNEPHSSITPVGIALEPIKFVCRSEGNETDAGNCKIYHFCKLTQCNRDVFFDTITICKHGGTCDDTGDKQLQNDNPIDSTSTIRSRTSSLNYSLASAIVQRRKPIKSSFVCSSEGRYADPHNETIFHVCHRNVSSNASSRHYDKFYHAMVICPNGQVYDKGKEKCILRSPILSLVTSTMLPCSDNDEEDYVKSITGKTDNFIESTMDTFQCKSEGRYPDPKNSSIFHICHKNQPLHSSSNSHKFYHALIICPAVHVYDSQEQRCVPANREEDEQKRINQYPDRLKGNDKHESTEDNQYDFENDGNTFEQIIACEHGDMRNKKCVDFSSERNTYYKESTIESHVKSRDIRRKTCESSFPFTCARPGRFPDPFSGTMYYLCFFQPSEGGLSSLHFKCPEFSVFDPEHEKCSRRNKCFVK